MFTYIIPVFLVLAGTSDFCWGQETFELQGIDQAYLDSASIELRTFDAQKREAYLQDPRYSYDRKHIPLEEGRWSRMWNDFLKWLSDNTLESWGFWNIMGYLVATAAVLFVIFGLMRVQLTGLFSKASKKAQIGFEQVDGDIHKIDFETLITQAKSEKAYRRAVRLMYLETLKDLTRNEKIDWKVNKTNQDYIHELSGQPFQADFVDLTLRYEYVWYGDFPIQKEGFESMEKVFRGFRKKISQHK